MAFSGLKKLGLGTLCHQNLLKYAHVQGVFQLAVYADILLSLSTKTKHQQTV
jgi:hypothetical protein